MLHGGVVGCWLVWGAGTARRGLTATRRRNRTTSADSGANGQFRAVRLDLARVLVNVRLRLDSRFGSLCNVLSVFVHA